MVQQTGLERRMSQRASTALSMQVYAYGMMIASGISVEMSAHGLLIRIERDYSDDELAPGKHLDVMLASDQLEAAELMSCRWLPITVVRKWEEGIAARFIGVGNL
jgi:hypothetical protein